MTHKNPAARTTFRINRFMLILVVFLLFFEPTLLKWYCQARYLSPEEQYSVTGAFYASAAAALYALWNLDRLLKNILDGSVFVRDNVRCIRRVCLCCALVALFCAPAALYYPPMIFLTVIMGFLCLVVNVVREVMDAAVTIREENDLTV